MTVRLVSVYTERLANLFLYELLKERLEEPQTNISHRSLPSFDAHCGFVRSRPYRTWYLIEADGQWVGAIYLTTNREVGIHIRREHRGRQHGRAALQALRELWPGPLLANVNPNNEASIRFFARFGARHIQNTYEIP